MKDECSTVEKSIDSTVGKQKLEQVSPPISCTYHFTYNKIHSHLVRCGLSQPELPSCCGYKHNRKCMGQCVLPNLLYSTQLTHPPNYCTSIYYMYMASII